VLDIATGFPEPVPLQAQVVIHQEIYDAQVVGGVGSIRSLSIRTRTGMLYAQAAEALALLQTAGELEWHLGSASPLKDSPPFHVQERSSVLDSKAIRPVCTAPLTPSTWPSVTPVEKHILMLVNARRLTLEEIARLLNKKIETIYYHLIDLKQKKMIDF
jgi:DNA-binding CsgD family transcriptional regulator